MSSRVDDNSKIGYMCLVITTVWCLIRLNNSRVEICLKESLLDSLGKPLTPNTFHKVRYRCVMHFKLKHIPEYKFFHSCSFVFSIKHSSAFKNPFLVYWLFTFAL
jgi:hypothetical protein